jgi:TonB family protein
MRFAAVVGVCALFLAGSGLAAWQAPEQTMPKPGTVLPPTVMKEVRPEYPRQAMAGGKQGAVRLECVVKADGTVDEIHVIDSLGAELDEAAVAALKQWTFKPGTKDGTPVAVQVKIEMSFTLKDRGPRLGSPEVYTLDAGVSVPKPIKEVKPPYTAEAKRAGIQGTVEMDCVVLPDGTVGDVRVTKKLDPGLDDEAVKTLRQWRFEPGQKDGKPVPVQVSVEMSFTLR